MQIFQGILAVEIFIHYTVPSGKHLFGSHMHISTSQPPQTHSYTALSSMTTSHAADQAPTESWFQYRGVSLRLHEKAVTHWRTVASSPQNAWAKLPGKSLKKKTSAHRQSGKDIEIIQCFFLPNKKTHIIFKSTACPTFSALEINFFHL